MLQTTNKHGLRHVFSSSIHRACSFNVASTYPAVPSDFLVNTMNCVSWMSLVPNTSGTRSTNSAMRDRHSSKLSLDGEDC
mmetsp:Transcript_17222/g.43909  ORF Transcript_17222/g.43909 Transcript_17222/m.43909 type:complete len:80 (+) Transcript_17222:217-456(+)